MEALLEHIDEDDGFFLSLWLWLVCLKEILDIGCRGNNLLVPKDSDRLINLKLISLHCIIKFLCPYIYLFVLVLETVDCSHKITCHGAYRIHSPIIKSGCCCCICF